MWSSNMMTWEDIEPAMHGLHIVGSTLVAWTAAYHKDDSLSCARLLMADLHRYMCNLEPFRT